MATSPSWRPRPRRGSAPTTAAPSAPTRTTKQRRSGAKRPRRKSERAPARLLNQFQENGGRTMGGSNPNVVLVKSDGTRTDGRKLDELRPIKIVAGVLERADGS